MNWRRNLLISRCNRALLAVCLLAALLCAACQREQPDMSETPQVDAPSAMPTPTPAVSVVTAPFVSMATAEPLPTSPAVPSATPAPEPVPAAAPIPHEPPVRDLFALAQRYGRADGGGAPLTRTLPPDPDCCDVGHEKRFFVTDLIEREVYEIDALLLAVSDNAYWYADENTELTARELERAADVFERKIRPPIVDTIGDTWKPGVDGDPRLTVLHTPLVAAAGYFSASDSYPRATHPHSNEREMIVMDGDWLRPGSTQYFSVLAHEFQHAVHWNLDLGEDAWLNEGMSEVATEIAGYQASFIDIFLRYPEAQLNYWPDEPRDTLPHYGGATLFVEYLAEHYGGDGALAELAREPLDGVNGVQRYLSRYGVEFADVFADWTVANFLDSELDALGDIGDMYDVDGLLDKYRYSKRSVGLHSVTHVDDDFSETTTQPQLTARYYELRPPAENLLIEFEGDETVAQFGTECHSGRYCWWGGSGDSIDSTLEREFDLSVVESATLEFWMWHEIEEDWDYAYASVSTDAGETWTTLDGEHTTREDPLGANYGAGLTGNSGGGKHGEWVRERMDLSRYAGAGGESVLLRFEYITDDAVNIDGIVIDDIAIPEIGFADDAETDSGWRANGFRRTDNTLSQTFELRIIMFGKYGGVGVVEPPEDSLDIQGFSEMVDYAVLVVAPTTHSTYQPARYTLTISTRIAD